MKLKKSQIKGTNETAFHEKERTFRVNRKKNSNCGFFILFNTNNLNIN